MAFSATYTDELLSDLEPLMKRPQRVMLCAETVSLEGVRQFYVLVPGGQEPGEVPAGGASLPPPPPPPPGDADAVFQAKVRCLLQLLSSLSFHQVRGRGQLCGRVFLLPLPLTLLSQCSSVPPPSLPPPRQLCSATTSPRQSGWPAGSPRKASPRPTWQATGRRLSAWKPWTQSEGSSSG